MRYINLLFDAAGNFFPNKKHPFSLLSNEDVWISSLEKKRNR